MPRLTSEERQSTRDCLKNLNDTWETNTIRRLLDELDAVDAECAAKVAAAVAAERERCASAVLKLAREYHSIGNPVPDTALRTAAARIRSGI